MSKLYNTYISLKNSKQNEENILYLFKSGMFFICLDEDAKIASKILNLKLTNLNNNIVKCGFPTNSFEKYSNLLNIFNYTFKIVDSSLYNTNTNCVLPKASCLNELLLCISNVDTNTLSVKEAYEFINNINQKAKSILNTL